MWTSTVTPYQGGVAQTATTSTYKYDDNGIRIRQTVDGVLTRYLVDDANHTGYAQVLEEKDANLAVTKTYTLGHDVVAQQSPSQVSGETLTFLHDGHGSTRALLDESADVASVIVGTETWDQRFAYDGYGNMIGGSGLSHDQSVILTSLLYSGEQTDRGTGLQYLRARYYDPSNGRFNRLDPFAGDPSSPASLHKYLYAQANPIRANDPSGLIADFTVGGQLFIIGAQADIMNVGLQRLGYNQTDWSFIDIFAKPPPFLLTLEL